MKSSRRTVSGPDLHPVFSALSLGTFAVVTFSFSLSSSHADTYHPVEAGETLSSIGKLYNVEPSALREANKLSNLGDNSPLGAMLLRVPGEESQTKEVTLPRSTPPRSTPSPARYFGTVTKYVSYVVQDGDTLESVAASFAQNGQSVSAEEISAKNKISGQPITGSTLLIPLKTTYGTPAAQPRAAKPQYSAAASTTARPIAASHAFTTDDSGDIGVSMSTPVPGVDVSEEIALPFARAVPSAGEPIYQAPNQARPKVESRGALASRGGYGNPLQGTPALDGAQILQNGEELLTAPSPRVRATPVGAKNLARVAKIAHNGARIRRLPDAGAVTLYKCGIGTEIAVLKQQGPWSAILMSDRSTGWMPTRYLKFTGASVDITSQVVTGENRGDDSYRDWTGGYQSNHPAVRYALRWLGTPYRYGGQSARGIDCSSLMQKAFASCGVRLPRVSRDQARVGRSVAPEDLQPGDRLYFSASGTRIDHTGMYMGNGLYVHASGGARRVVVSRLSEPRSWNIFVCARR